MDDIFDPIEPEYYDVIPEFNGAGRLCNYHTRGTGETVRVPAAEWDRFNELAGRQYEIVDGVVVYDPALEPCLPDGTVVPQVEERLTELETLVDIMLGGDTDGLGI